MPIINRRNFDGEAPATTPPGVNPSSAEATPAETTDAREVGRRTPTRPVVIAVLGLMLGVGLPIAAYFVATSGSRDATAPAPAAVAVRSPAPAAAPVEAISLDFERLIKTGALYALAKKERDTNVVSLNAARQTNSSAEVLGALEIILEKIQKDQQRYVDDLASILQELKTLHKRTPQGVQSAFEKEIAELRRLGKNPAANTLESGLKILQDMPAEGLAPAELKKLVRERL